MHYKYEGIEDEWIVEAKNKLARRVSEKGIRNGSEHRRERAEIVKVKLKILAREDTLIANEVIDVDLHYFY